MEYHKSSSKSVVGATQGADLPSIVKTIEKLLEKVQTSTLLEDRKDACRALKSLSKCYRLEVGAQGNEVRVEDLKKGASGTETLSRALDSLCNIISGAQDDAMDCRENHSSNKKIEETEIISEKRELKSIVVMLLASLLRKESTLFTPKVMQIVLSGYDATMSSTDQTILRLMAFHEEKGGNLLKLRTVMWGKAALEYYSLEKDLRLSLSKQPKMEEVLGLLVKEKLLTTISRFPLRLELNAVEEAEESEVYDPRFVLPLIYHLISPDSLINCHQFIELKALSLTLTSLSSASESLRSLGYSILSRFYQHLESSNFYKDRMLWLGFLDCIRSELIEPNQLLPRVVTAFYVRTIDTLLAPNSLIYPKIRDFVTQTTRFDNPRILRFVLSLLHSTDDKNFKRHGNWALMLLEEGIQTEADFNLCNKHRVFDNLMVLSQSPITDVYHKCLILKVFKSVVRIKEAVKTLTIAKAFLTWLLLEVISYQEQVDKASEASQILCHVICTVWAVYASEVMIRPKSASSKVANYLFYPTFGEEIVHVLVALLEPMSAAASPESALLYMETMLSVVSLDRKCGYKGTASRLVFSPKSVLSLITMARRVKGETSETEGEILQQKVASLLLKWTPTTSCEIWESLQLRITVSRFLSEVNRGKDSIPWISDIYGRRSAVERLDQCEVNDVRNWNRVLKEWSNDANDWL